METDLTYMMKNILFYKLRDVDIDIPFNYLSLSIEELMSMKEKADRAKELLAILERAKEKLEDKPKPIVKRQSTIALIRDVLKMRKFVIT